MNTSKADAIKKALELKQIGHTNKGIIKQLAEMGYYNPKTLKPWTPGMIQRRLADLNIENDNDTKARLEAIRLREQGYRIKHIVLVLKADGFINFRTDKPFGLYTLNQWLNGIEPVALAKAKLLAKELDALGFYPAKISRTLANMGYVNLDTGKPYSKSGIVNWVN